MHPHRRADDQASWCYALAFGLQLLPLLLLLLLLLLASWVCSQRDRCEVHVCYWRHNCQYCYHAWYVWRQVPNHRYRHRDHGWYHHHRFDWYHDRDHGWHHHHQHHHYRHGRNGCYDWRHHHHYRRGRNGCYD
jgi:hypothetical protein